MYPTLHLDDTGPNWHGATRRTRLCASFAPPQRLLSDAHEQINDTPTVTVYYQAKPQPGEHGWDNQPRTLLSLALIRHFGVTFEVWHLALQRAIMPLD